MRELARLGVVLFAAVAAAAVTFPTGSEASDHPSVLCGNFGGQTMPPHIARRPNRCDVTRLDGLPEVYELRNMEWTRWAKGARGQGRVDGNPNTTIRFKRARSCGQHGEYQVYSKMSINGRPFRPILYCGD